MKLEDQVVSLDLAKKLKELGVKQESLFWWYQSNYQLDGTAGSGFTPEYKITQVQYPSKSNEDKTYSETIPTISAFTVAELGLLLSGNCGYYFHPPNLPEKNGNTRWFYVQDGMKTCKARTEASARAKMLIYLLENKLLIQQEGR